MEFEKYPSVENSYRERFVNACHDLGIAEWVAMEKLDGANMSFLVDGELQVQVASRNQILTKSPEGFYDFYGCTEVVEELLDKVSGVAMLSGGPIRIYGEFFGTGVQKRVKYGAKRFVAFDIQIESGEFLPWDNVRYLCDTWGIDTAPELARGTLQQMLDISPEFTSLLCEDAAEGFVIKPLNDSHILHNGSRAILKQKSAKFDEKGKVAKAPPEPLPLEAEKLYMKFSVYLTENRLYNTLSKLGNVTAKDFGKVLGLLIQDAREGFEKECGEIDKDNWKLVQKSLGKLAGEVVRQDWLNIIDNSGE